MIALAMTKVGELIMASDTEELFIRHFGVSSEQFTCELEADFEKATPEERAEFEKLVHQANAVLPGMRTTLDHIEGTLSEMKANVGELRDGLASLDARVSHIETSLSE